MANFGNLQVTSSEEPYPTRQIYILLIINTKISMAKLSTVIEHKVYIWQSVVEKKTGLREFQCVVERGEILTLNCKGPRLRSA